MKLYCAWSSFLQNWDRRIINKIYYYYIFVVPETVSTVPVVFVVQMNDLEQNEAQSANGVMQNQRSRELISTRKTSHKHKNKVAQL